MLWRSREDNLETWRHYLTDFSATAAEHAAQAMKAADFVLGRVADQARARGVTSADELQRVFGTVAMHEMLLERSKELPLLDVVAVIGLDGDPIASSRSQPAPHINLADRDYHQKLLADASLERYVSAPFVARYNGQWTFYVTRKIRAASGEVIGVALAGMQLAYFENFYRGVNLSETDSAILLLRDDATLLVRYPRRESALGTSYPKAPSMRALAAAQAQGLNAATVTTSEPRPSDPSDTQARITAIHAVDGFPLVVGVTATQSLLLRNWQHTAWFVAGITLLLNIVIAGLTLWIHRLLHRREAALRQLDAARAAAENASRVKSQFLANMSHEIRTPLHGMLGMAQLLRNAPDQPLPQRQRQVELIERSGRLLMGVIDDVLDFSRIEAGRMTLERIPLDLRRMALDGVSLFEAQAQAKGLLLRADIRAPEPCVVLGDPLRLSQMLNNLLSNAVKFTLAGEVVLTIVPLGRDRWRLAVRDTGIGLTPQQRERICQPFEQADDSTTRRFGGTGLGLAIVSRLAQLQGGRFGVDSEPGKGSAFWLELSLPPAPAAASIAHIREGAVLPLSLAGLRVLVAEDNEINMLVVCGMLEAQGVQVHRACDGEEAVQAYTQGAYDVVLMDVHMPRLDGLEATRRIRELEARKGLPPVQIVALTADALPEDRLRCTEAGMDGVMTKPFKAAQLLRLLEGRRSAPATA
jgi:hypothetical protein